MEEGKLSKESKPVFKDGLDFEDVPAEQAPIPHSALRISPVDADNHFRPLIKNPPSAEERWASKANAIAFPGL